MAVKLSELKGLVELPARVMLIGGRGVGKTTIAIDSENPYFINLEKSRIYKDLGPANQGPETYNDVMDLIRALAVDEHEYKTVVIDTLDKLEVLITEHVCKENGYPNINQTKWGEGLSKRHDEWCNLLTALDWLREHKRMTIILVAHTQIEKIADPMLPEYDRTTIKLYRRDGPMIEDWADIVGYCMIKVYTTEQGERHMATTAGERVICCQPDPSYDAKTRYPGMPKEIPLKWDEFAQYFRTQKPKTGDE